MKNNDRLDSFQALADPGRRQILMMLAKEKQNINTIAENFDISRPAVSKHIKVLAYTGFIRITEKGRERYCELNQEGFEALKEWLDFFETYWTSKLKALDSFLKTKHAAKRTRK